MKEPLINSEVSGVAFKGFIARVAVTDKRMLISDAALKDWFRRHQFNYTTMVQVLKRAGLAKKSNGTRYLGGGTLLKAPPAACVVIEFDLSLPGNDRFLDP